MMRNEKGITLSALVITVIVLLILVGTGLLLTYSQIDDVRNAKLASDLGIVGQAVVEQYQKAVALGKIGVPEDDEHRSHQAIWIGDIIEQDGSEFFSVGNDDYLMYNYIYETNQNQEDYYYELNQEALQQLGIDGATDTYIVNYKTGEVLNKDKPRDYDGNLLYLPPVIYENDNTSENVDNNFNDW